MELMLLSNSRLPGQQFLQHALPAMLELLPPGATLGFVPYAQADHDGYTAEVRAVLAPAGITVHGIHANPDPVAALSANDALFIGGGNTFRLLNALHRTGLRDAICDAVRAGLPYLGSSAGTNVACPTIRTTNDMPIVQPESLDALGLISFQINTHYLDPDPANTHMSETREERLLQFLECNDVPVLALREGTWLRVHDTTATLGGALPARCFRRARPIEELPAASDVSYLLASKNHELDEATQHVGLSGDVKPSDRLLDRFGADDANQSDNRSER